MLFSITTLPPRFGFLRVEHQKIRELKSRDCGMRMIRKGLINQPQLK